MRIAKRIDYDGLPAWAKKWDFLDIIEAKATQFDINVYSLIALVKTESDGNPLSVRYEPGYRWTFEVENFAEMLGASVPTIECLQSMSFGLGQVMGGLFFELGGALEPLPHYRWPTAMLDKRIGLEYACRAWQAKGKNYITPQDKYASYNGGSVRFNPKKPDEYVNQAAVDRFMKHLKDVTKTVRY